MRIVIILRIRMENCADSDLVGKVFDQEGSLGEAWLLEVLVLLALVLVTN